VVLMIAAAILVWQTEVLTKRLSRATLEGRPLVRMIASGTGLSSYYATTMFAVLDLSGKFTRAMFVGHALHCSASIDDRFADSFAKSPMAFLEPIIRSVGFGGLSLISFVVGPILIQGSFMLFNLRVVRRYFRRMRTERVGVQGMSMGITPCLDELSALADWAVLKPIAQVIGVASIPNVLEDTNDAGRMWDRTVVTCLTTVVNLVPDNVFQVCMMARFFALTFDTTDDFAKAKLLFSMFCSIASALKIAAEMIACDLRLTVSVGVLLILFFVEPIVRTLAAFGCEDSHIFSITAMSCTDV